MAEIIETSMAKYTLEEVDSRKRVREFLDLPKRLYKNDPHWICPLDQDIENRFHVETNEMLRNGEAIRWIVRDEQNQTVGRIAAFYNRDLVKASEYMPTGGCGFFESINDQEVANLLFNAARDWLAARGMEAMDGPINFGDRDQWWGLLVKGFEFTPLYTNPYNFEYYIQLFDSTLANWVGEQPGVCTLAQTCGHAGVMEFNGDVYSCDHFVFPQYKLGNIYSKTLVEMMYGERQQKFGLAKRESLPTQCKECPYLFACNGECPKNRFCQTKDGEPGLNYLCQGYYQFFDHAAPYMDFMKRELQAKRAPANVMEAIRKGEL